MSRISIELVPRNREVLVKELQEVKKEFPKIDTVNIPDIMRFSLRSWDACSLASEYVKHSIPHIRSIDFSMDDPQKILDVITKCNLSEVLIVSGDPPQDLSRKVYRTSPTKMTRFLKKELPELKVYAAIDPYRNGLKAELDYILKKIDSGTDAFFTQPFFDIRFMELYSEQLNGHDVYWGVSPVMGDKSRSYWENRNNAFFPKDFKPNLEWNRDFAARALDFANANNDNIYFMPIKTGVSEYLSGILN
jgi:methylenetetrahydrofolate reductase (NADPH)